MRNKILNYISKKNITQKKKIIKLFQENPVIAQKLDDFMYTYSTFLKKHAIDYKELCDSYLLMVNQMTHSRIHFFQTGQYPTKDQSVALATVYKNEEIMTKYMLGLALSQFLWRHHFEVFSFYCKVVEELKMKSRFLEVGCGHGLFLIELLRHVQQGSSVDIVDISKTSLNITRSIVETLRPDTLNSIHFIHTDINQFKKDKVYDFITMGEVLEHVEKPQKILRNLFQLLDEKGRLFISTCTNCPAIDHVYHFKTIDEIRDLIVGERFHINKEVIAPSEKMEVIKLKKFKLDIMYAAILTKET